MMATAALPPMTTREAKRAGKKRTAQFQYTASQHRRADRIDELESRRKALEDKDRNRKLNKRKREEQDAKTRAAQRKLLHEGKITLEDTWGKVTASQPRLNAFFSRQTTAPQPQHDMPLKESRNAENKANGLVADEDDEDEVASHVFDSQEDTLVDKANLPNEAAAPICNEFTDDDLLRMFSSQPGQLTPAQVYSPRNSQKTDTHKPTRTRSSQQLPAASPDTMPPKSEKTRLSQVFNRLQRRNASQHAGATTTAQPALAVPVITNNPSAPVVQSTESAEDDSSQDNQLANVAADSEDQDEMAEDAAARQVRSSSPSPESLHRRRHLSNGGNDDLFVDDNVDEEEMARLASAVSQQVEASFEDDLPDEELLEAARRAEEEAEKEEKKEGE